MNVSAETAMTWVILRFLAHILIETKEDILHTDTVCIYRVTCAGWLSPKRSIS